MGFLWRAFAPRPLKKARRALHPGWVIEDAAVRAVRGRGRRRPARTRSGSSGCVVVLGFLFALSLAWGVLAWPALVFRAPDATPRYAMSRAQAPYVPWWVVEHGIASHTKVVSGNWRSLTRRFGGEDYGSDPIYGPYHTQAAAQSHARRLANGSAAWWTVNYGTPGSPNPGQARAGQLVAPHRYCAADCHPGKRTSALGWGLEAGWLVLLMLAALALLGRKPRQTATT